MQIIVTDPTGANEVGSFEDFVLELRSELATITKDVDIKSTDIGRGFDLPAVLVTIGGLFFLGKKIEENLEAWTSLARKFLAMLQRIRERFGPYRLDEHGATLLAIDRILRKQPRIRTIEKTFEQIIPISPLPERPAQNLDDRPETMYIQCFRVNTDIYYVFAIKSTGSVEIEYSFEDDWATFSGLGYTIED